MGPYKTETRKRVHISKTQEESPADRNAVKDIDFTATYGKDVANKCSSKQVSRPRNSVKTKKLRYKSFCHYYACYYMFVGCITIFFLVVLLALHLIRCMVFHAETPLFKCFADIQFGPPQQLPNLKRAED